MGNISAAAREEQPTGAVPNRAGLRRHIKKSFWNGALYLPFPFLPILFTAVAFLTLRKLRTRNPLWIPRKVTMGMSRAARSSHAYSRSKLPPKRRKKRRPVRLFVFAPPSNSGSMTSSSRNPFSSASFFLGGLFPSDSSRSGGEAKSTVAASTLRTAAQPAAMAQTPNRVCHAESPRHAGCAKGSVRTSEV